MAAFHYIKNNPKLGKLLVPVVFLSCSSKVFIKVKIASFDKISSFSYETWSSFDGWCSFWTKRRLFKIKNDSKSVLKFRIRAKAIGLQVCEIIISGCYGKWCGFCCHAVVRSMLLCPFLKTFTELILCYIQKWITLWNKTEFFLQIIV